MGMKAVEHREVAFTRHAERMGDALGNQAFNEKMAGNFFSHVLIVPRTGKARPRRGSHPGVDGERTSCLTQAAAVRRPTPSAAPTLSSSTSAAPASVAAYQPRSMKTPKTSGEMAKPTSRPEYTMP